MKQDELSGRLIVLETFVMMSLGLFLSNAKNDRDYSKSAALLDHLRQASSLNAAASPPAVQAAVETYANHLSDMLAENIPRLRGERYQSH